jgi:predicted enzyme involved in methoxymalonyl-ACP biosynthesis
MQRASRSRSSSPTLTVISPRWRWSSRPRIAQLINKSNQYNLTTHRYSEAEVAAIERDPNCFALQVRLADKFGDNGMISVAICRKSPDAWEIDTWLMSCRVMGRRVENMLLREIVAAAKREGATLLRGRYLPTERNVIVVDHYAKLGFTEVSREPNGASLWELNLAEARVESAPMQIRYVNYTATESAHV